MSVTNWVLGNRPGVLLILLLGLAIGGLAGSLYAWLFDDDDWTTNGLVVGGVTLSVALPLIIDRFRRPSFEDTELDS